MLGYSAAPVMTPSPAGKPEVRKPKERKPPASDQIDGVGEAHKSVSAPAEEALITSAPIGEPKTAPTSNGRSHEEAAVDLAEIEDNRKQPLEEVKPSIEGPAQDDSKSEPLVDMGEGKSISDPPVNDIHQDVTASPSQALVEVDEQSGKPHEEAPLLLEPLAKSTENTAEIAPLPDQTGTDSAIDASDAPTKPEPPSETAIPSDQHLTSSESTPSAPLIDSSQPEPSISTNPTSDLETQLKTHQLIISQRERQLMTAMQENAALTDSVNVLKAQLEQLETVRSEESIKVESVIKEFTERLGTMDKQYRAVVKERDSLRQNSTATQGSLQASLEEKTRLLEQKEMQIEGLMSEGEKLSKTEMKHLQTIKKLRAKETETDAQLKELTANLATASSEISELKERVTRLVETEKKQADTVRNLTELNEQQAKQLIKLEGELAVGKEKQAELQASLDRAWNDLTEARKLQAEANNAAAAERLEKEVKANEELHRQLETLKSENDSISAGLRKEIMDLRSALTRVEDEAGWREDNLRRELATAQQRLRSAESRNDDLQSVAQESTRPYLRQIELLQSQHSAAIKNWEGVERELTVRLHEVEMERQGVLGREKGLVERVNGLVTRISVLESEVGRERQERARVELELETERHHSSELKKQVGELEVKLEGIKGVHSRALEEAKGTYQRMLRQQVQEERDMWEERMRSEERRREVREVEKQKLRLDISRRGSGVGFGGGGGGGGVGERGVLRREGSAGSSESLTGGLRTPSSETGGMAAAAASTPTSGLTPAAIIERLHSSVKQLEGQVSSLQTQLQMASQTRDELAEELVRVTNENENMKSEIMKSREEEAGRADLERRYNAALELLGEKTEQVEELQADINDMKQAFRAQVQELLAEVDELKKGRG
ncbi:hypothetical protein HDV00_002526 [Rhizophlyctis rosea]|nr:hypothetical protein HDV00_002526 [Rhizophlyctis rosea]